MIEIDPVILEKILKNLLMYFRFYLPGVEPFIQRNVYSLYTRMLCEKKLFFEFRSCIFTLSLLSPLGQRKAPSFKETSIYFIQGCLLPSLAVISSVIPEKEIFRFRQYNTTLS